MTFCQTKKLDKIMNQTFKHAKKLAHDFYFNDWSNNPPRCPAFDNEIINVSHEGWNHLAHFRKRTRFELMGRLFILERAKELLETSSHWQSHLKREQIDFWSFEAEIEKIKIKVVIRSIKNGQKHFYSVIRKGSVQKEIESN